MPSKLQPRPFRLEGCTKQCSLSAEQTTPEAAGLFLRWFCEGANNALVREKGIIIGYRLSLGAIGRHRSMHLVPITHDPTEDPEDDGGPRLSDVDILEAFIQKGAKHLKLTTSRITPEMTMKAMELKYKLTQGNAFQGFLDAISNEYMGGPETGDAVKSEDEQAQASPE